MRIPPLFLITAAALLAGCTLPALPGADTTPAEVAVPTPTANAVAAPAPRTRPATSSSAEALGDLTRFVQDGYFGSEYREGIFVAQDGTLSCLLSSASPDNVVCNAANAKEQLTAEEQQAANRHIARMSTSNINAYTARLTDDYGYGVQATQYSPDASLPDAGYVLRVDDAGAKRFSAAAVYKCTYRGDISCPWLQRDGDYLFFSNSATDTHVLSINDGREMFSVTTEVVRGADDTVDTTKERYHVNLQGKQHTIEATRSWLERDKGTSGVDVYMLSEVTINGVVQQLVPAASHTVCNINAIGTPECGDGIDIMADYLLKIEITPDSVTATSVDGQTFTIATVAAPQKPEAKAVESDKITVGPRPDRNMQEGVAVSADGIISCTRFILAVNEHAGYNVLGGIGFVPAGTKAPTVEELVCDHTNALAQLTPEQEQRVAYHLARMRAYEMAAYVARLSDDYGYGASQKEETGPAYSVRHADEFDAAIIDSDVSFYPGYISKIAADGTIAHLPGSKPEYTCDIPGMSCPALRLSAQ